MNEQENKTKRILAGANNYYLFNS